MNAPSRHSESSSLDPLALPEGPSLAQEGSWVLWLAEPSTGAVAAWQEAFVGMFGSVARDLEQKWPLPEGVRAHVVLGQEQCCLDWSVDEDALGFHAVSTQVYDEETGEFDLGLPDDHRCYVNLAAHQAAVQDDEHDEASLMAGLATLPHEMAHVALFARHTLGKTPLQVFDENGGEQALREAQEGLEQEALAEMNAPSAHGGNEDWVEAYAQQAVDRWRDSDPQAFARIFDRLSQASWGPDPAHCAARPPRP